jgi:hypothetical protein
MVTAEVTAIVAGASAVAGGAIVGASNYVINRVQAADARKAELRRVLIDLGTVVSRIDHRLRTEPEPGKASRAINEAMSQRAPQFDHAIGLLRRRLLDPHLDELVLDMSRALATATVMAPPSLLPALGQLTEAMDGAEHRDDEWWATWNAARTNYFLRCREAVGFTVPEPAVADANNDGWAWRTG